MSNAPRGQEWWDRWFVGMAQYVATASKDPSTKVGAVIVDPQRRVVSVGFNGLPRGVHDNPARLANRELKYKMIVHGEINAILFAERPLTDCTLYTYPFMPCSRCAGQIIQKGIREVVSIPNDNPRWQEEFQLTREMFGEAGVALRLLWEEP